MYNCSVKDRIFQSHKHCDVRLWAQAGHLYCTAQVDSAFCPLWDGKTSISSCAEY